MVDQKKRKKALQMIDRSMKKKEALNKEWYSARGIMSYWWAIFYILLGGREAGKSYDVMNVFLREWKRDKKPFTWLRLKESSTGKLLCNNAMEFVDADLRRKYDLELTTKGTTVFDHGEPMAKVLALSTFYNDKGVALFDNEFDLGYNIALDEMNKEKNEKNTFDIVYAFVNQMENLVRSTKHNMKIFLIGNTLEEASDLMTCFNFIPEEFGRYKLIKNKKQLASFLRELRGASGYKEKQIVYEKYANVDFGKRAVIEYMQPSEKYLNRRHGTIADILTPTASTFTNKVDVDKTLIYKGRLIRPSYTVMFTKDKADWFTVWDGNKVCKYNGEQCKRLPMRPYLDELFAAEARDNVFSMFDTRAFVFRDLITQKIFKKCLELLKPRK